MADPKSISVKQLSTSAKSSVAKAIAAHQTTFKNPNYTFGFVPPYWWLGIVIRNPDSGVTLAEAQKLASDVAGATGLRGGTPGCIIGGGHITVGFAPPLDVSAIEE
jgi:hypothetical protein